MRKAKRLRLRNRLSLRDQSAYAALSPNAPKRVSRRRRRFAHYPDRRMDNAVPAMRLVAARAVIRQGRQ
jgi:hypothetical protein